MPGDNSDWIQEKQTDAEHDFLASGGEMGARVRALDRSKTPPVSRRITGGSMRVRSSAKAEKCGTTFTLTLPISRPQIPGPEAVSVESIEP